VVGGCISRIISKYQLIMKIYYAGAIRGGRDTVTLFESLLNELQSYGEVLTEHIGSKALTAKGEVEKMKILFFEGI